MDTLLSFFVGVLSSIAAVGLLKYKLLFAMLPKTTRKGYLIDLEKKIRQMPFIYKDLDTDVINDFVDVEFQSLDLGTLQLHATSNMLTVHKDEKLKRNFRVLFLGNAGIGKTTFQRRTILTIINNEAGSAFLYHRENPIPLYIPLKAIDNSGPFPIYRYIVDNNPLFANRYGLRRLTRLSRSRRLFLFLDGYDEIPFTGGTQNFVQEELGIFFFPASLRNRDTLFKLGLTNKPELIDCYTALANCRVWLSSRREFFEKNSIASLGTKVFNREEGTAALELKGIGNNRIKLTRKIFDKYRRRSKAYYEFLNEEYFLYEIDNSDDEIRQLSYNPLFLTVMCYIYAQKAVDEKNHKVEWAKKFDELILECVELLLNDLDENKARDLPKAHKEALLTRRNPFVEEKKIFLQYFSMQLYFDDKPVFTGPYIKKQLRDFFEVEYKSPASTVILQNLEDDDAAKPNVALQLIYQGVFVLVDTSREEVLYDFPHRRFREVLASKYVNTPSRYKRLLASAEKEQFGEFLNVFFKSESYNDPAFHDEALTHVLDDAVGHVSDDLYVRITLQFIKLKPHYYNASSIVGRFLTNALLSDKRFRVSVELLRNYKPAPDFISNIRTELKNSSKTLNYNRFYLCAALLSFFDPRGLIESLCPLVGLFSQDRTILPIIFQYLSLLDPSNVSKYMETAGENDEAYLDFCYATTFNLTRDDYWRQLGGAVTNDLAGRVSERGLITFFFFLYKYCPARYDTLRSAVRFPIKKEMFEYVDRHKAGDSVGDINGDEVYILSRDKTEALAHQLENRETAFLMSKIFRYKEKNEKTGKIENRFETKYAVVPITNTFRQGLSRSLKTVEFKVIARKEFESFVDDLIEGLTTRLVPKKIKYIKFADLPEQVRSSKVRDEAGYTREGFMAYLRGLLKKDAVHKYGDVKKVSEITKEIKYAPEPLINHFQ